MSIELQPTHARNGLHILIGGLTITALPARNRGLPTLDSARKLTLGQTCPPTSHQNQISTFHTNMVSSEGSRNVGADGPLSRPLRGKSSGPSPRHRIVWSLLAGAVVTVALIALVQPLYLRWDRARWIRRFPKLDDHSCVAWSKKPGERLSEPLRDSSSKCSGDDTLSTPPLRYRPHNIIGARW